MVLYMLSDIPESAFLHQVPNQVTWHSLGVVEKAEQSGEVTTLAALATQENLRFRRTERRGKTYGEHYVPRYAVARDEVGGVSIAGSRVCRRHY